MPLVFSPNLLNEAPYRTVQRANTALFNQLKSDEKQLLKEWGYENKGATKVINSHLFLVAYIKYHSLDYRINLQQASYQDAINSSKELKNDILKGFKLEARQELMSYIVELIELNRKNRLNIKITDNSEQLYILIDDMVDQKLEDWTDELIKRQLGKFKLLLSWRELKLSSEVEEEKYNTYKSNIEALQGEGYQLESNIDLKNTDSDTLKDSLEKLVLKKTHQDLKDDYKDFTESNLESLGLIHKLNITNIENTATDLSQLLVDNLSEDWQSQAKYIKLLAILNKYLTIKEYPKNVANDMSKDLLVYVGQMERIQGMKRLRKLTNAKAA